MVYTITKAKNGYIIKDEKERSYVALTENYIHESLGEEICTNIKADPSHEAYKMTLTIEPLDELT